MTIFANVKDITIPEGNVKKIQESISGRVLWEKKKKYDRGGISHIGQYVFRKIKSIDGVVVTINKNISEANGDDFNLEDIQEEYYEEADGETYYSLLYTVYAIKIPNYNTLVINSGVTINPVSGIVAFRCKGDCTLNGSIITLGMGTARSDLFQMTHSKMIDRFLFGSGGGIFITCGGTFTAPNNARIGASWSGVGTGESISHGACGYGGRSYLYKHGINFRNTNNSRNI